MNTRESHYQKWLILFSAGMYFFYEYVQMTIFNTIPQQLLNDFHISAFSLGKLSACYFLMQVILLFPAGLLLDRFPVKKIIVIAMSISITGTLLFSASHNYFTAMIARLLSGIGGAFAFLSCMKLAAKLVPDRISLASGLLVTLAVLGGFIAQTPFAWLTNHMSWRIALRILSGFGMLILINILINIKETKQIQRQNKNILNLLREISAAIKNSQTLLTGVYIALMNLPIFIFGALWGGLYLQKTHHFSYILSTFIASMLFVGVIIGSPLFGFLSENIFQKRKPIMQIGAILSLAIILLIIFTQTKNSYYIALLFLSLGLTSSAQCIGYPVIIESNKAELAATATSIASVIIMGGGALIKIFYSKILDMYSAYSPHAFQMATMILPLGFIFAVTITFFIRETSSKEINQPTQHVDRVLTQQG